MFDRKKEWGAVTPHVSPCLSNQISNLKYKSLEIHSQQNQIVAIASKLKEALKMAEDLCSRQREILVDKPDPIRNSIASALNELSSWHQELEDSKRGVA